MPAPAAPRGGIATLTRPADAAWTAGGKVAPARPIAEARAVAPAGIEAAAQILRGGKGAMLMLGGTALRQAGLDWAGAIAARTGARLMAQGSNARVERGAGRVPVERVPYPVDQALAVLKEVRHLVLVGASAPVAFFAYPGKPGRLLPEDCQVHWLATPEDDLTLTLAALAEAVGAKKSQAPRQAATRPDLPTGAITLDSIAAALGALLPENAVVCDESVTTGRGFFPLTRGAAPHDWLQITGGAISLRIPLATVAAIAVPARNAVNLQAHGSGM